MYMYVLAHVFSVLIRNIIKIRIIHNTRRFARYYATLGCALAEVEWVDRRINHKLGHNMCP